MKMAHAPPGHHSVIGRPSVGGLSHAEYVIYRGEQVSAIVRFWQRRGVLLSQCPSVCVYLSVYL